MNPKEFYCVIGEDYYAFYNRLPDAHSIENFILRFPDYESFENLMQALSDRDYHAAYNHAMTLKGICLNFSFSQLADALGELIDYLKKSKDNPSADTVRKLKNKITELYTKIIVSIHQYDL